MNIQELEGKKICILGYGKEGRAMIDAIRSHVKKCKITVADENPDALKELAETTPYYLQSGAEWLSNLETFDVIIKSPGIPPNKSLETHHSKLTSATQIFFDSIANSGSTVIGVTGSKGKSTTASLLYAMLKTGKKEVYLVGNIGEPAISHIDDAKNRTLFVMELSSYQLMDLKTSPQIAVITSFFPEHLNYHGSIEAYQDAKKNITRFQKDGDLVFFSEASHGAAEIAKEGDGAKIPFSANESPVSITDTQLIGDHNLSNIAGAYAVAMKLGIPEKDAIAAIKAFKGLPHRLQSLGIHHGQEWIDDAISTTPESTIAALDALDSRVTTIILGGQDRGNDFTDLAKRITLSSIQNVIIIGESGTRIKDAIKKEGAQVECFEADSMEQIVAIAKKVTGGRTPLGHPIVLLSTASPSYGMFKNFEEKGDLFQREISEK
jgi:UDP-N-acetylmuramoylalanine--D-glutamate ligase